MMKVNEKWKEKYTVDYCGFYINNFYSMFHVLLKLFLSTKYVFHFTNQVRFLVDLAITNIEQNQQSRIGTNIS